MPIILRCTIGATAIALLFSAAQPAFSEEPKRGGTLTLGVKSVLPTLDCHALGSPTNVVNVAPMYSTLLRFDPDNYPKIVGDIAVSWTMSEDRQVYTFRLHPNVKFHDGSPLTSADVKASYERIANPPAGVTSRRKGQLAAVQSMETPDPLTLVVKLSRPDPAILIAFASPYGCIYSAKKLAENPKYPETAPMGSGPFKFVDYVPGSSASYARFDDYFVKGLPYLDAVKTIFVPGAAHVNAIAGGQVDGTLSQMTPSGIDEIKAVKGNSIVFPVSPFNVTNMVDINTTKPPLNDVRVRRALNLALDRRVGEAMVRVATNQKGIGILFARDVNQGLTDAEIAKLPGFNPEVEANRAEARKLLSEAGVKDLTLTLLNLNSGEPYTTLGVFVVDQMRKIGVKVNTRLVDAGGYYSGLAGLNFDLAIDANVTVSSDPTEVLTKFLPDDGQNYTGAKDPVLLDLYARQSQESDPEKRRQLVKEFERRVVDQAYLLPMFRSELYAALANYVKGWKILPSQSLNQDLRQVWLDKK